MPGSNIGAGSTTPMPGSLTTIVTRFRSPWVYAFEDPPICAPGEIGGVQPIRRKTRLTRSAARAARPRRPWANVLGAAVVAASASLCHVAAADAQVAKVAAVTGEVDVLRHPSDRWSAVQPAADLRVLDKIRSGPSGWVRLLFQDSSVVVMGPGSLVRLE